MNLQNRKNLMNGQTLIEVIVILSASVILLTALTSIIVSSLDSNTFSRNQNQATQYAQQGVEITRSERPAPGTYCLGGDGVLKDTCGAGANIDNFKREVIVSKDKCGKDPDVIGVNEIMVTVSWTDGKCSQDFCRNVKLVSCQEQ